MDDGSAMRAIAAIGDYGEIYDRDLGPGTARDPPGKFNALWKQGGMTIALLPR